MNLHMCVGGVVRKEIIYEVNHLNSYLTKPKEEQFKNKSSSKKCLKFTKEIFRI